MSSQKNSPYKLIPFVVEAMADLYYIPETPTVDNITEHIESNLSLSNVNADPINLERQVREALKIGTEMGLFAKKKRGIYEIQLPSTSIPAANTITEAFRNCCFPRRCGRSRRRSKSRCRRRGSRRRKCGRSRRRRQSKNKCRSRRRSKNRCRSRRKSKRCKSPKNFEQEQNKENTGGEEQTSVASASKYK